MKVEVEAQAEEAGVVEVLEVEAGEVKAQAEEAGVVEVQEVEAGEVEAQVVETEKAPALEEVTTRRKVTYLVYIILMGKNTHLWY